MTPATVAVPTYSQAHPLPILYLQCMSKSRRMVLITPLVLGLVTLAMVSAAVFGRGYRKFVMGNSLNMAPTINSGELCFVKALNPKVASLRRYQIICFWPPVPPRDRAWVMRVVGLPGEEVEVRANSLWINGSEGPYKAAPGVLCTQQWLAGQLSDAGVQRRWSLGTGEVFVVGDNLGASYDSRYWGGLNLTNLLGVVVEKAVGKQVRIQLDPVLPVRFSYTFQRGNRIALDVPE